MHFMKTLYFTSQNGPPRPIFSSFFDEIKRPKKAKNDLQSGQNARKIAFSHFFFMFTRCARERDFTKVGRVKSGCPVAPLPGNPSQLALVNSLSLLKRSACGSALSVT